MDTSKLFDFIKALFTRPDVYEKMKPYEKAKHFFMVNRFMSMKKPDTANALQHNKINTAEVMDFWQRLFDGKVTRVPQWMYTKTKAPKKKAKNKYVKEETIELYCQKYGYSRKQVDTAIGMFGDEMITKLKLFEALIAE
jgi:hypothetical protein